MHSFISYKVIFCLAFRVVRHFQTHRCTGQQQFLAPPGVFDMDGFHCAVHIYMGNKTVGTVKKNAVHDLSVFQCLLHFHFCLIRLRRPGIKAAEDDLPIAVGVALQPIRHGTISSYVGFLRVSYFILCTRSSRTFSALHRSSGCTQKTGSCKRSTTGRSPFISYSFVIHRPCRLQ